MSEETCIPTDYQSDHLFLLLGTNALPNFVAAKLLLRPDGRLYLVHSAMTKDVAERLARFWTETEKGTQPSYVPVNEGDGADIRRKIELAVKDIESGQIGLNYTGGTKIMSVHSCLAMLDHQTKTRAAVTLSYLDARSNTMYIEHGADQPFVSNPVLWSIEPSLQTIVSLHAFKLNSPIITEALLPELSTSLADAHQSSEAGRAWRKWCDDALRKSTRTKKASDWDKESPLAQVVLPLPADEVLRPVADKMREVFKLNEDLLPLRDASLRVRMDKARYLCEWLDGKWLEHFAYQAIQEIKKKPDSRLHDIGMGIHPQSEQGVPDYDIDIGVMQGYRLYAISCTTDADPGMCKLKLFEAYVRARNMAGDEAHVGLVCLAANPKNLEKQLSRSWDAEGKVRVFGQADLQGLSDQLANWFNSTGTR